jgi:NAD(P)-dependent dehydrogenase (short-subunit alcohol dehydrogenase family)
MSSYFESLALTLRPKGIAVTNIRFGFVDTKMAKAPVRPFMISADKAASIILRALKKRPIRLSYPLPMVMLVRLFRWGLKLRVWCG